MARPRRLPNCAPVLLVLLGACGGGGGGGGEETLPASVDQDYTPEEISCLRGIGDLPFEQAMTFTVGRTGSLTRVEILLEKGGGTGQDDVEFELRSTDGGVPSDKPGAAAFLTVLSSDDFPDEPGLVGVDLPVPVSVIQGQIWAIVLRHGTANVVAGWVGGLLADYAGGDGWFRSGENDPFELSSCDSGLRTHVVVH